MSPRVPARRRLAFVAGFVVALLPVPGASAGTAADAEAGRVSGPPAAAAEGSARPSARPPFVRLIARVMVNMVGKGDIPILLDAQDRVLVPAAEFARWGLAPPVGVPILVDGEAHVVVSGVPGFDARFDPKTVTLELQIAANTLPATTLDLGPQRRAGVVYPSDTSFFLNYGLNASGDDSFAQRRYQFATELGARLGNWLFYSTTDEQWGGTNPAGFTRLLTNLQYDDRQNLRRLTLGDFFTPAFDLSASVPLGGVSLTKLYSMNPYFIQYPTAAFQTEVAFPSTVQVRIDGNLVAQRQVQPGPVDITNISGVTGGQNISVVVRDPFGREQVLQQPFFFATNAGLAEGLHEYSYNLGFLRRGFGIESDDYGPLAAAGYHRYAVTNQLTLGVRGQATDELYNAGVFGTYQHPQFGIVGAGVSAGGHDGRSGPAASGAYSYTGNNASITLGAQYVARDFAQLSDLVSNYRLRSNQYASGSVYFGNLGTLTTTYTALTSYDGPQARILNVNLTRAVLDGKGLLALNYIHTQLPQSSNAWLLSFRYFFDNNTSVVAGVGGARGANTQAVSLERSIPQGEGVGYTVTAGHVGGDGSDGAYGRAFVQVNAAHVAFGADYEHASRPEAGPRMSQAFVAGSIGWVGGSWFAARPVQDSFALVRVPGLRDAPVYANGWYVGKTDAAGEVVATNIASYYDNSIAFGTADVALDYVFSTSEKAISPPTRSGTLVAFDVRKYRAVHGVLSESRDGKLLPLEFREIVLERGDTVIRTFTARRGEFYVEGIEPGDYRLRLEGTPFCAARVSVPDLAAAIFDAGTLVCEGARPRS